MSRSFSFGSVLIILFYHYQPRAGNGRLTAQRAVVPFSLRLSTCIINTLACPLYKRYTILLIALCFRFPVLFHFSFAILFNFHSRYLFTIGEYIYLAFEFWFPVVLALLHAILSFCALGCSHSLSPLAGAPWPYRTRLPSLGFLPPRALFLASHGSIASTTWISFDFFSFCY